MLIQASSAFTECVFSILSSVLDERQGAYDDRIEMNVFFRYIRGVNESSARRGYLRKLMLHCLWSTGVQKIVVIKKMADSWRWFYFLPGRSRPFFVYAPVGSFVMLSLHCISRTECVALLYVPLL